jgi:signal transduction histidine kinase
MAWMPLQLLIVEDRPDDAELILAELRRSGYDPTWTRVETPREFEAELGRNPDIIICDYSLPAMTAPDALRILRDRNVEVPLIVVSGVMDEETCVTSLRLGAVDYLLKDRLVRLVPAIEDALQARRLTELARTARREGRETADILRSVVDHAPAAICVRDAAGSVLWTNAQFDLLAPSTQMVRSGANHGGPPPGDAERRRLTSAEQACLDGARKVESEESYLVDGEERTYLVVRYPVVDGTGRRFAVGTIYVDISKQKHVEDELRKLDKFKDDFVATVSHELRTPLTSIFGYTEMLLHVDSDPGHRRMVEVIDRNSRRLLSLVDDLLTLSRVDSGVMSQLDGRVEVTALVAAACSVLEPEAEKHRVELVVDVPAGLPPLIGDRTQLERVMLNLMSNAVKFSEEGAEVRVAARPVGAEVQLSVEDTGMGIPAHEQKMLFTRFFRSEEARRRVIQGTGLGLAVVREIVERHRGTVAVESAPGTGTTFTVTLRAAEPPPADDAHAGMGLTSPPPPGSPDA